MPDLRAMTEPDFDALALGAWIMGTGGGGDPYHSLLEMKKLYAGGRRVSLMDPLDLDDEQLVAAVGQMGAPLVIQEKMTDANLIAETVRMMERHLRRSFSAIALWEIGGNNSFQPFLGAALLGLPVVDADAMGRAFPQADMNTFAICDLAPAPWTMRAISSMFGSNTPSVLGFVSIRQATDDVAFARRSSRSTPPSAFVPTLTTW